MMIKKRTINIWGLNRFFIILLLPISNLSSGYAQLTDTYRSLGNGVVKIMTHTFSAGEELSLTPVLKSTNFANKTYIIQDQMVLNEKYFELKDGRLMQRIHEDLKVDTTINVGNTNISSFKRSTVKYIIDWQKQKALVFTSDSANGIVYRIPFRDMTLDFCYKMISLANWANNVELSGDKKQVIAGHICSAGTAILKTGEEVKFYYTTDSIGLVSPLNGFISPKTNINVMAFFVQVKGEGLPFGTHMLFKVEELLSKSVEGKFFKIPKQLIIKEAKTMAEISKELYSPNSN